MKKYRIDKKYIQIGVVVLVIVLIAILFNNLLEQGTKYKGVANTLKGIFVPITGGFVLAYLLNPILVWLEKYFYMPILKKLLKKDSQNPIRKRWSRSLGVITTTTLFLLLLIGGLWVVIPQVYTSILNIVEDFPKYYEAIENWIMPILEKNDMVSEYTQNIFDKAYEQGMEYVNRVIIPNLDQIVKGIMTGIIGGIKTVLNIFLAVIISVYALFEKEKLIAYGKKFTYSYFSRTRANKIISAVRHVNVVFGGFINGKIIDSFIIGVLCYIFMIIVGFEYAVLISIIIGITNIIPYFGPFIGAIPSVLLLLVIDPKQGLVFAIFILILQQLDGNIIGPLILGGKLKLSSMWILIAILIGGGLFGVIGMILGAPTLACIYTLVRNDTKRRLEEKQLPVDSSEYYNIDTINEESKIEYFDDKQK